jgi:hypothetical protein
MGSLGAKLALRRREGGACEGLRSVAFTKKRFDEDTTVVDRSDGRDGQHCRRARIPRRDPGPLQAFCM